MWGFIKSAARMVVDALVLPWLVTKVIRTGTDKNRAATGEIIARAVAAQLVSEYPDRPFVQLVDMVVDQLGDALDYPPPGGALRRMAVSALAESGRMATD